MTNTRRRQRAASAPSWYRINNLANAGTAEVSIYNEIGLYGVTAASLVGELSQLQVDCLNVHINSPGGEIFEGLAILNALRAHPAAVNVFVDGLAASIASVIAMAGDKVTMMPNSQMMIHDGSGLCVGNEADMREMADLLGKQSENIASIYAQRAGGSRPQWRKRMRAETWYSAQEAVAAGLADEVAKLPARQQIPEPMPGPMPEEPEEPGEYEMAAEFDLSMFRYRGRQDAPAPPLTNAGQPPGETEESEDLVDTAVPVHHTDTTDTEWDGGEAERRLPSPMSVATARGVYAWYDTEQIADGMLPKQAGSLPHHEVSGDGDPGAANLPAVRNALARLSQSDIPQSDQDAVRAHLQAHLEDGQPAEEARIEAVLTAWSPDVFRTAMAKAAGMPPEDLPDTFRNAVTAAAGAAAAIPARATPAAEPSSSGWGEPAPVPEPGPATLRDLFRDAVAREASQAPAVITPPAPEAEQDSYDPTVIIRALREANQQ